MSRPRGWRALADLRGQAVCPVDERAQDCHAVFAHPATVLATFVVGLLVLLAGARAMFRYVTGADRSVTAVWRASVLVMLLVTLMGIFVPYRLRFAGNLYGYLTAGLILEYAVFTIAFPVQAPSDEHVRAADFVRDFARANPHLAAQTEARARPATAQAGSPAQPAE